MPIKTGDMMAYEEDVLAESLKEYISIDSDIELRKNRLALKSDFSLPDLYMIFDTHNAGFFGFREFEEVYAAFGLFPPVELLRLAFRNLDRDLDSKITMKEFIANLSPQDNNYKELVLNRKPYNDGINFSRANAFTPET